MVLRRRALPLRSASIVVFWRRDRLRAARSWAASSDGSFDSVAPAARSLASRAFNFSLPALDTSRAWRSQKTSSDRDRARASLSPSILTSRWSRRFSRDSFTSGPPDALRRSAAPGRRRLFNWRTCLSRRPASLLSRVISLRSVLMVSFWSGDRSRVVRRRRVSARRRPIAPSRASDPARALRSRAFSLRRRLDRAVRVRLDAGFGQERLQARHFGLQGRHVPCHAAGFLRLFDGLTQPAPAGLEPRLPRTAIAAGGHFRQRQLFRARFGRVRPRPFPLTL